MSLKNYKYPCRVGSAGDLNGIFDADGGLICRALSFTESSELCSILNAHFQPKKKIDPNPMGNFIGTPSGITMKLPEVPEPTPQPNREETDRVAAKYYERGRTLEVQWRHKNGMWITATEPQFCYEFEWRIKPAKRRVVVEVYENPLGMIYTRVKDQSGGMPPLYKLLGTIEGEVEA